MELVDGFTAERETGPPVSRSAVNRGDWTRQGGLDKPARPVRIILIYMWFYATRLRP